MAERSRRLPRDERGVSEVLGYTFVFGLVLVSVAVVSVGGVNSLESARTAEQVTNAEKAFDVLGENMAELYHERAPSRATEIDLGETELFFGPPVTINVTINDRSVEHESRPIVQRLEDGRRLVYEAGAVFRTHPQSETVLRDPPHVYRADQAHLTVPALSGDAESLGDGTILVRSAVTDREVTAARSGDAGDEITVNVTSPRYGLWAEFLRDQPGLTCTTTDSENRVSCTRDSLDSVYVSVHEVDISLVR